MERANGRESAPVPGARKAWGRFARPGPGGLPRLWLLSDPVRLPDPRAAMEHLPRGAGVVARGLAPGLLRPVARLARQRGLKLLVAGDGRAALALRAGLHLPDRRQSKGLLPFLVARRSAPGRIILTMATHGGQRSAARARRLRPDGIFLSPLFPTQSHPGAPALGAFRWAALARRLPAPCMALGGITAARLGAVPRRAAGVAAIGGLAPPVARLPQ
ncbi:MAG: thiamine phosphate synthase [Roseomonas sp.]|nr:thiamine phosphate synthase [Roseomonas sp.]MCA3291330.1 thiamine phosphate synthase [Roseomonas sp.]MCA3295790.1 thiamine phosphate synthase [Roseomonas sp.]